MKPIELLDKCMEAVDLFNKGEMVSEEPFVFLVLPRPTIPRGRFVRLFGKSGPQGAIATVKPLGDGQFAVAAYFPAVPIIRALGEMVGTKVTVSRA